MNRSIRKLVGGGAAALAIGGFFALIVAPQLAGATNAGHRTVAMSTGAGSVMSRAAALTTTALLNQDVAAGHTAITPSTSCTTAKANLASAMTGDKAEDTTERANATSDPNFKTTEVNEDKDELATRKPLVDAVRAACVFTKPAPSAQCSAALQSVKAAFQAALNEDRAEKAAGTEGTAGDVSEDQSERSRMVPMWQAIRSSCILDTHGAFTRLGSTK